MPRVVSRADLVDVPNRASRKPFMDIDQTPVSDARLECQILMFAES